MDGDSARRARVARSESAKGVLARDDQVVAAAQRVQRAVHGLEACHPAGTLVLQIDVDRLRPFFHFKLQPAG
jgi:hypothetical protein